VRKDPRRRRNGVRKSRRRKVRRGSDRKYSLSYSLGSTMGNIPTTLLTEINVPGTMSHQRTIGVCKED
jgi:hypothetical protein